MPTIFDSDRPNLIIAERPIKGIAFDLEGTIIDLEPLHFAAHLDVAKSLGLTLDLDNPETFTKDVPNFIGGPDDAIMKQLLHLTDWKARSPEQEAERVKQLLARDSGTYKQLLDAQTTFEPREGFLGFFDEVQSLGLPVSIGSLTNDKDAWHILERSGLKNRFDENRIILRSHVAEVKPHPQVYQETAKRMGVLPENQLVFEDSHNGAEAAQRAGSIAIGMPLVDKPAVLDRLRDKGVVAIYMDWKEVTVSSLRTIEGQRRKVEGNEGYPHRPGERK